MVFVQYATACVRSYAQIPEPKWVITLGDCPVMQAPFEKTFAIQGPADKYLKITHHIAGCSPSLKEIMQGLLEFLKKI